MQALQGDFKVRDDFCLQFNNDFLAREEIDADSPFEDTPDTIWNRLSSVVVHVAEQHVFEQETTKCA